MNKPSAYLPFYGNDFFEAIAGYSDAVGMGYLRAIWHYWAIRAAPGCPMTTNTCAASAAARDRVGAQQGDHLRQPVSVPAGERRLAAAALPQGVAEVAGDFSQRSSLGKAAARKRWEKE